MSFSNKNKQIFTLDKELKIIEESNSLKGTEIYFL